MKRLGAALLAASLAVLAGCVTNPVTGESEFLLVSESWDRSTGESQYGPMTQSYGGELARDPELSAYVAEVGQRVAAQSPNPLAYEFVVLNDGTPNAWALPGGKIAVNRGLLIELQDEAELAAVLGHEVVHAAARHGAKRYQSGILTQVALMGVAMSASDDDGADLIVGGAVLGASLLTARYGRDHELESDRYGMVYMQRAGYDPEAAVDLQRTFVRLSQGRSSDWLSGLFASHPPSQERVARNERTLGSLGGPGGERGRERYQAMTAELRAQAEAYAELDRGRRALAEGDVDAAALSARSARERLPEEPRSWTLSGDVAAAYGDAHDATAYYREALRRDHGYFGDHLGLGRMLLASGEQAAAERSLQQANALLPTAGAHLDLGRIAQRRGEPERAIEHFQVAAAAGDSTVGRDAQLRLAHLMLPREPARYFELGTGMDARGRLLLIVENRSPVSDVDLVVRVQLTDELGAVVDRRDLELRVSGGSVTRTVALSVRLDADSLQRVQAEVLRAQPRSPAPGR